MGCMAWWPSNEPTTICLTPRPDLFIVPRFSLRKEHRASFPGGCSIQPDMLRFSCLLVAFLLAACSSEEPAPSPAPQTPGPYQPPASSLVVESGAVKIRREVFTVAGFVAGPNPVSNIATPEELQRVRVVRYRVDSDPPRPARAIVVMMPGFLGGAGSFDASARALVRRSTEDAPLEAWAIDRRSNLLEDHHGLDVAEHYGDPEIASRYYFGEESVEGKSFGSFVEQGNAKFMSEWGLETTLGDLRKVIELVPQAERRGRVVLLGHSLGASIAETYASWDFDGTAGYQELASLVLVDGVAGNEGGDIAQTQEEYEKGGAPAPGGFGTAPGLGGIRGGNAYFSLPLLGTKVYPVASIVAMRGALRPAEVSADDERDSLLKTLLSVKEVPKMTNRAALGLAFDARSNALSFAAVNCGEATGGPMEEYDSLFGVRLLHPTDPSVTYDWKDYDATSPHEMTAISELARSWYEGPGLDFSEWYFPQRLPADVAVASSLTLLETDWPASLYRLRALHGKTMDLPILGHAAGLMAGDVARFDALRALVDAVPLGPGRPHEGEARSSSLAFVTRSSPELSHIDPILGADAPGSPVAAWYDQLASWAREHSPAGGVAVPTP